MATQQDPLFLGRAIVFLNSKRLLSFNHVGSIWQQTNRTDTHSRTIFFQEDTSVPTTRAKNSDACVVVYSISDRASFRAAQEALVALQAGGSDENNPSFEDNRNKDLEIVPPPIDGTASHLTVPVVLLGNKKDLGHLRQVSDGHQGKEKKRNNENKQSWRKVAGDFGCYVMLRLHKQI